MTDQEQPSKAETLRIRLPDWQDPVVVLTALADADYDAVLDEIDGDRYVTVLCPRGREADRERVRGVLTREANAMSLEGPAFDATVRFDDET
jgi:hypothetical protein